jgi:hypothetical protein
MPIILHLLQHKPAEVIPERRVYLFDYGYKCPVKHYLDKRKILTKHPSCITQLKSFINRFATHGWIPNPDQFEVVQGKTNLYELKPWAHRFYCFVDGNMVILATACEKKSFSSTIQSRHAINKADDIKKLYFDAKAKGEVTIDEYR